MLDDRLTEQRNPRSAAIDSLPPLEIIRMINAEDAGVAAAVGRESSAIARASELALDAFRAGGRLLYVGAGTSGRLGVLDAAEMPPTYGTDPDMVQGVIAGGPAALVRAQEGAEDDPAAGALAMDERRVGPRDFVLGIATSGTTPYVHGALGRARELGARTGFLLCTPPPSSLRETHDVVIAPLTGPEVVTGSTRMKAGTATKMVLNAVTTAAMIRFGKVDRNLMVDLQVTCAKLQDRGERILMASLGVDRDEARSLLRGAAGHVKTALARGRAALRAASGLVCGLLALTAAAAAAEAQTVPPDEAWRQLDTEHFVVTYPERMPELARRAALAAERAHALLSERFVPPPGGRIQLLLTDHADISNGFASARPYNQVTVFARPPMDGGGLSYFDDWLELVITHELVHTFHLDMTGPIGRVMRAVLGRPPATWPVFPSAASPTWVLEGLAIYYESRLTGAGRVNGTWQEMVLRADAVEGEVGGLDQATGSSPVWPAGNRPYVYGARFLESMAREHGEASLAAYARGIAGLWIPYRMDAAARGAFGETLGPSWAQWARDAEERHRGIAEALAAEVPLTRAETVDAAGYLAAQPLMSRDGAALAYLRYDGVDQSQIRIADPGGASARRLARVNGLGGTLSWGPSGDLYFTQLEFEDRYRLTSDLYRVGQGGRVTRVTRGARISHADVSPDGRRAVAVQEGGGSNALVLVDLPSGTVTTLAPPDPEVHWAHPRWSPDGRRIAATRWERPALMDIVVLEEGGEASHVTRDRAVDAAPVWTPDGGSVVWSSDRTGIYNLHAAALDGEGPPRIRQITNLVGGAFHPAIDSQGRWIHFASYHADGWHVERIPYDPAAWFDPFPASPRFDPVAAEEAIAEEADTAAAAPAAVGDAQLDSRPYSAAPTLRPHYWSPLFTPPESGLDMAGLERAVFAPMIGVTTGGRDLVGRHAYSLAAQLAADANRFAGAASYSFAGLGDPVLGISLSQRYDATSRTVAVGDGQGGSREFFLVEQDRAASLSATIARQRYRSVTALSLSAGLAAEHLTLQDVDGEPGPELSRPAPRSSYGSLRATLSFANAESRAFSYSREDGVRGFVSARVRSERGLGAEDRGVAGVDGSFAEVTGELAAFKSLKARGFANHVLAARLSAGAAFGPGADAFHFDVGEAEGQPEPATGWALFGGQARLFPLRGYRSGIRSGRIAWTWSGEYRFPLALVDRGLGAWPIFLDRLHGAVFADAGNAWGPVLDEPGYHNPIGPTLWSGGVELSAIVAPLYQRGFSVRFGAGVPLAERRRPRFHVRVGNAF